MLSASYLTQDVWFTESTGAPTGLERARPDPRRRRGRRRALRAAARRAAAGRAGGVRALRARRHPRAGRRRAMAAARSPLPWPCATPPPTPVPSPCWTCRSPAVAAVRDRSLRRPHMIRFVIPAYNERENIPQPARRPRLRVARDLGARVIFVDDGSTDGTAEAIDEHGDALHLAIVAPQGQPRPRHRHQLRPAGRARRVPRRRRDRDPGGRQHLRPRRPARECSSASTQGDDVVLASVYAPGRAHPRGGAVAAGGLQVGLERLPLHRWPARHPHALLALPRLPRRHAAPRRRDLRLPARARARLRRQRRAAAQALQRRRHASPRCRPSTTGRAAWAPRR